MHINEKVRGAFDKKLLEFLKDVREEVCSRCSGRPVGDPRGNPCGVELPLPQLVAALRLAARQPGAGPIEPTSGRVCPCPMKRLAALAVEAAEDLERRRQRCERVLEMWNCD